MGGGGQSVIDIAWVKVWRNGDCIQPHRRTRSTVSLDCCPTRPRITVSWNINSVELPDSALTRFLFEA